MTTALYALAFAAYIAFCLFVWRDAVRRWVGAKLWYFVLAAPNENTTVLGRINANNSTHNKNLKLIADDIRGINSSLNILKQRQDRTAETIKTTAIFHNEIFTEHNRRITDLSAHLPRRGEGGRYVKK